MMIGLDVGEKRIGVAKTDEMGFMAHAVGLIERRSDRYAVDEIKRFVIEWNADKIIVGLPKEMSGKVGKVAEKVMRFGELIRKELPEVQVEYWDERLSTKGAERNLIEMDVSRSRRKQVIDKLAAQSILQNYMEAHPKRFPAC